jgi:hypothetical protein
VRKQSSLYPPVLPAWRAAFALLGALALAPANAGAQARGRVNVDENFRLEPRADARALGRVRAGTAVEVGAERDGWHEVTVSGWIWARSTRASSNREFDLVVSASGGENLRAAANGTVVARLESGTFLDEVARDGGWVQVRRTAWMWGRSLDAPRAAAAPTRAPAPAAGAPPPTAASLDRQSVASGTTLRAAPDGDTVGAVSGRLPARVVARTDGWARVLVEAWVRESDLAPADDSVLAGVTAAEVRGGGSTYVGRVLRWTVQLIAVQTADELRRDLPTGGRYLLARGPLPETGFVYVVLTPDQARSLEALDPLTLLTVLGRVRTARSQYLGNPVLDLIEFSAERER